MITYKLKNDRYEVLMPSLSYGTGAFERHDCDKEYFALLDRYMELGGSCIDTARVYCDWVEGGHNSSEGVIGRWLRERGCRDKTILVTKGGHPDMETWEKRLNPQALEQDLSESLELLGSGYIDIYLLHRDDPELPVEEIMPILNEFYQSGRVHFIGVSNWTTARIEEANKFALANGMEPIRISQISYSLAHSSTDIQGDETIVSMDTQSHAWYRKHNFPVMAFTPQAKGFFAKLAKGDAATHLPEGTYATTSNLAKLAKVKQLSQETGVNPAVIPLGYLNSQPFFVSSVFAATKVWQIDEDMAAQDLRYDPKTVAFLENLL